jgi:hypothetical protein
MDGIIIEKIPVSRLFTKKVGFQFGMYVWVAIAERHDVTLEDFDKLDPNDTAIDALFYAAEWYAFRNKKRRYDRKLFEKSVELMSVKQMERIRLAMEQSRVGGKTIMQISEERKKKQQPKS